MLRGFQALLLLACLTLAACGPDPGQAAHLADAPDRRAVTVQTASGPVTGFATAQGQAFLGLPFAAPPIGALRWREPLPAASWTQPRDATRLAPGCLQNFSLAYLRGEPSSWLVRGQEDCLTLNVYAPAGAAPETRLPVMVWLYGGAFNLGNNAQYDPSVLAQKQGVLVVAPNYRLGTLGFLSHPALRAEAGGQANLGLLDQQAALRWVQDNAGAFGGDPGRVTLFGQSAGAWSVCYQLASPGAAGLFHRAILQSGTCTLPEAGPTLAEADAAGLRMAAALGCGTGTDAAAAACLRSKSADTLAGLVSGTRGATGASGWGGVIGDPVLPTRPQDAFTEGRFNQVPVIDGATQDEGRLFSAMYRSQAELFTESSYQAAIRHLFGDRADAVLGAYPLDGASPALVFAQAVTDGIFVCPAARLDRTLARHTPVFSYAFQDPNAPIRLWRLPGSPAFGAYHAAELAYLFQTRWALADPAAFTPPQQVLADAIQDYWGRFARDGAPGGGSGGYPLWPAQAGSQAGTVLALRPEGSAVVSWPEAGQRCAFWDRLGS